MAEKFTNLARSTLASGISAVATSLTVASGDGNLLFPVLGVGDFCRCVLLNKTTGDIEIIKVTARTADVLTITRADEDIGNITAVAKVFNAGDLIELRTTKGFFDSLGGVATTDIQALAYNYGVATGSGDSMVLALTPALASYSQPGVYYVKVPSSNVTGIPSLNINGNGAVFIVRIGGGTPENGDLSAGETAILYLNAALTRFELLNPKKLVMVGNWSVKNQLQLVSTAHFGNSTVYTSSAPTINWGLGNKVTWNNTSGGAAVVLFTDPAGSAGLTLVMKQAAAGSNPIWPGNVKWVGGTEPGWSTGLNDIDIITFYYDLIDDIYYGAALIGFA